MQSYLITSSEFNADLHEQLQLHLPTYALYRDKLNPNYDVDAKHHVQVCSQFDNVKSFLHQKPDLAKKLNATGVHLNSSQFDKIEYCKSLGLEVIISTHTHEEVLKAQALGADAVVYSPIFSSPNKGEPKGIKDLTSLVQKVDIKVFGLGGIIDEKQIKEIEKSGAYGFASIRYFYK